MVVYRVLAAARSLIPPCHLCRRPLSTASNRTPEAPWPRFQSAGEVSSSVKQMIRIQNDIALSLTRQIFEAKSKNSNFIFSPLSIQVMLNLITAGSSGAARGQLLSLLQSTSVDHLASFTSFVVDSVFADGSPMGGPRLNIANGLWLDSSLTLKHSFKHLVDNVYKAACEQADFQNNPEQVVRDVNSWGEKKTHGLIKGILDTGSVNRLTRLILANALYFKGAWKEKFDASQTEDDNFHLVNGSSVEVPFMTSYRSQMACCHSGFKVLGLPYKQGSDKSRRFTMYFFLPDAKDGLPTLIQKMGCESGFLERYLPFRSVSRVNLKIPRFKIQFGFEASDILKELGVVAPFHAGGLTEMADSSDLYVDEVFHKAFIEVNETGTEAAAITTINGGGSAGPGSMEEIIDFVADRPFLYLIREDKTAVVLFVGHVLNPLI